MASPVVDVKSIHELTPLELTIYSSDRIKLQATAICWVSFLPELVTPLNPDHGTECFIEPELVFFIL